MIPAQPTFHTRRLAVYAMGAGHGQVIYVATTTKGCIAAVVCHCTVERDATMEFIETCPDERGRGYATELWRGLEIRLDRALEGIPVTREGARLVATVIRARREGVAA